MSGGSYVGNTWGPTAAVRANWDSNNNQNYNGIDFWDITYSCEHGAQWLFVVNDGNVNLDNDIGDAAPDGGWGDFYNMWVVLYSCQVMCSPIEKGANWPQPWITANPKYVLHGTHIVNGFRTNAYVAPAVNVSTQYALQIRNGDGEILWEWFYCVWTYSYCQSSSYDKPTSVFWNSCRYDSLSSWAAKPPAGGDELKCWYY
jgi:hypothetical protein